MVALLGEATLNGSVRAMLVFLKLLCVLSLCLYQVWFKFAKVTFQNQPTKIMVMRDATLSESSSDLALNVAGLVV